MGHQLRETQAGHVGSTGAMGYDDNPRIENYYSKVTWQYQSEPNNTNTGELAPAAK